MVTRFKDTNPGRSADAQTQQDIRDVMQARIDRLEQNINAFIAKVADVTFNVNEEDAQSWMNNWQANLLSGKIGPDVIADAEAEAEATDPA